MRYIVNVKDSQRRLRPMHKSLYSLMLLDELVDRVDRAPTVPIW